MNLKETFLERLLQVSKGRRLEGLISQAVSRLEGRKGPQRGSQAGRPQAGQETFGRRLKGRRWYKAKGGVGSQALKKVGLENRLPPRPKGL